MAYLEAWSLAATGQPLPWPAPEALLIKFVAHHLWDPARRETDLAYGMPQDMVVALKEQDLLRSDGPHAPATVRRRLSSWSKLTKWRGLKGRFNAPGSRAPSSSRLAPAPGRAAARQ
ncbi:Phage-related integrase (fragment) [Mesorhizobium sp. ORS 3324]